VSLERQTVHLWVMKACEEVSARRSDLGRTAGQGAARASRFGVAVTSAQVDGVYHVPGNADLHPGPCRVQRSPKRLNPVKTEGSSTSIDARANDQQTRRDTR